MEILKSKVTKGFTLIEAAIALVILSVIAGVAIVLIPQTANVQLDVKNEEKLDKIQKSILAFYNLNGYIPCPASRTDLISSASYGVSTNCFATSIGGTVDTDSGVGFNSVRTGVIPTRTLGLRDIDMLDEYGNKITYAVVKDLAKSEAIFNNYINTTLNIEIKDTNDNRINKGTDPVAFVIMSHGNNGLGAFNLNGTLVSNCSGSTKDVTNCSGGKVFRDQFKNFDFGSNYFDDTLRWVSIYQLRTLGKGNNLSSQALNFQYAYISRKEPSISNITLGNFNAAHTLGAGQWLDKLLPATINHNSISGLSVNLATGLVSVPAGTYYIKASSFQNYTHYGQLRLFTTGGVVLSTGITQAAYSANLALNGGASEMIWSHSKRSYLADVVTLATQTDFYLQQYVNSTGGIALNLLANTPETNLEATPLHLDTLEILKLS